MDITYVTERIIVLTFPETGSNETYCANLKEVVQMLRIKHKTKYMIFNLSEKRHDLNQLNPNICEFGWPSLLAPPLERLCSICKAIDSWLTCDGNHFAVIHSKGDRGRTGVVIAAFMHYTNICATADQALDRFAMKRFYDDKLSPYMQPSQKRYVHYFAGLLSGAIKMNNNPLFLHHIIVHGIPNFESDGNGCRAFVKIYQAMKPIHTTGVYIASDNRAQRRVVIFLAPSLQLRGDILIKCYHNRRNPPGRAVIFRLQFHTCTLELNDRLVFNKEELDDANADSRFPNDGFVEFLFNTFNTESVNQSPHLNGLTSDSNRTVIEHALHDPIVKWDSYEQFDLNSEVKPDSCLDAFVSDINNPNHTHGPVDGSLYATVAKTGSKKPSPVTFSLPNSAVDNTSEEAPHTISIDSGISSTVSANPHHNPHTNMHSHHSHTNGTSSGFPSPINVEVEVHNNHNHRNKPTSEEQAALDELLSGMLKQIESFPDHPNTLRKSSSSSKNVFSSPNDSKKTPIMDRKSDYGSIRKPLSNGGSTASSDIVPTTPHYLTRPVQYNTTDDRKSYRAQSGGQPFSYGVTSSSPAIQRRKFLSESKDYVTENLVLNHDSNDNDDVFSDYTSSSYQDVFSEDGTPLTWLQRQQRKLKTKKEGKGMEERHWKERQVIEELRRVTKRIASDDSSSRENSPPYTQPLHINTMPSVNGHNVHNPHTNMHSHTNGTSSGFPSPINVEVEVHNNHNHRNKPTSEEQAALDELLSGMLKQIESFPDHPNTLRKSSSSSKNVFSSPNDSKKTPIMDRKSDYGSIRKPLSNGGSTASSDIVPTTPHYLTRPVQYNTTDDRKSYRAQSGGQPFSYGVTSSSPAIQRRKFLSESKDYVTENLVLNHDSNDNDDVFSDYTSSSYQDVFSEDGTPLTWLQRQQRKLKTKKEGKGMEERHWKERQVIEELRRVTKRIASDDSSSRENSPPYTQPLHINTMPSVNGHNVHNGHSARNRSYETPTNSHFNTMSSSPIIPARKSSKEISFDDIPDEWKSPSSRRPLQRQRSDNSHNRERPFVAVKRAHEEAKEEMYKQGKTNQEIAASSKLYGSVYPYSQHHVYMPNARVEPQSSSLTRNGLLIQSQNDFDEVDSSPLTRSRPQHSTPSYKKNTVEELPTSWSPSFVGSSSPPGSWSRDSDRPPTPGFPYTSTPGTPYTPYSYQTDPRSPPIQRKGAQSPSTPTLTAQFADRTSPGGSVYYGQSQRSSLLSLNDSEVITQHPFSVKDTSNYWYKPNISRENAINMLRDKPFGTFVVRDSNSFPGAYGLALKVSTPPPNVQSKTGDMSSELVRHFLIEPTNKGVRLKGCPNEPTFGSLSALVYQHSVTAMALPSKLIIPDSELCGETQSIDKTLVNTMSDTSGSILSQGAACNVLYLVTVDMESLTGPQAVRKAVNEVMAMRPQPTPTVVHFKVSSKGITLTDNNHRLFFRRHYPLNFVSFCGIDPDCRKWNNQSETITSTLTTCLYFGFVARKTGSKTDNQCHIFAEFEREQPASAIVNFVNRVMATIQGQQRSGLVHCIDIFSRKRKKRRTISRYVTNK